MSAAVWNLIGAVLCTIGTAVGAYGLHLMYLADPSNINLLFVVGGGIATVGVLRGSFQRLSWCATMTKHDYIVLGMVVAAIATNFLGAAFTIKRLRAQSGHRERETSHKVPFGDIGLPAFSFSIITETIVEIKEACAAVVRVVRVVRERLNVWAKHD